MARQHIAEGAAQIIDDEGRAVQRVDAIGGEVGRVVQHQLRQAVAPRAVLHLIGQRCKVTLVVRKQATKTPASAMGFVP
jgi:hypothetical protein